MFALRCLLVTQLQHCSHLSLIFVGVPAKLLSIELNFTDHKLPADTGEFRATRGGRGCSISMTESFQGAHRYRSGAVTHFCLGCWKILKSIINNICGTRFSSSRDGPSAKVYSPFIFARQNQIG